MPAVKRLLRHPFFNMRNVYPQHMKRQLRELFIASQVMFFGSAVIALFEPLYLWEMGYTLQDILLYWVVVYGVYLILLPFGAKIVARIGYEYGMFWGSVATVAYLASLYMVALNPVFFWITPIVFAVQKSLYWPAYHADFITYISKTEEGEEVGDAEVLSIIIAVLAPLCGGLILEFFGFFWLFGAASVLIIGSNFWTLRTREKFTPYAFDYFYPWKRLIQKGNIRTFVSYLGYGEELVQMAIWPIFIFVVVQDFFGTGLVAAASSIVTALVTFYVGKVANHGYRFEMLRIGSVVYALSWFLRIFVVTGAHVFFADSLARTSKKVVVVPLNVITYDKAKNHTIMHTIVFWEFALIVGKLIAAALMFFLLFTFEGFVPIFIVAGFMTLLYALLK